jgi:Ni,Fe-hydrogenase I cytochrome b subunit
MSQSGQQGRLFGIYLLLGLVLGYVDSQTSFLGMVITAALIASGVVLWNKKRPQDLQIPSHWTRVFIALMYAILYLGGYFLLRKVQPTNYRANDLAALAILSLLLAIYFALAGKKSRLAR